MSQQPTPPRPESEGAATEAETAPSPMAADAGDVPVSDVPPGADPPADASEQTSPTDNSAEAERDAYLQALQRLQAGFENYRKRVAKQQQELTDRANETLVSRLLPVLDTIDLALAHDPSESVQQVHASLVEVLSKEGLERIDSVEQPFDPNHHEAVMHEPGDGEQRVTGEMRAGYRWKGRVLRPAMVKVTG